MGTVVILGTGGTIAGVADDPGRAWHYRAGQLSVTDLLAAVPALQGMPLEAEQVAQVDSKDMGWPVWRALGGALRRHLAREDVAAVVVTHGTDTLEETAYLLHRLHDGRKPVVLTAAMLPATAPDADGPGNLRDAVRVAREAARRGLGGVVAVMHGRIWHGAQVRKAWSNVVDAFDAGGLPPLAELGPDGCWVARSDPALAWPRCDALGWDVLDAEPARVEIVTSHADADGWLVDAALAQHAPAGGLTGLIVAGTGHGTIHERLEAALERAARAGVVVRRSSRTARGGVVSREGDGWPACGALTPAQARIALVLDLMSGGGGSPEPKTSGRE